MKFELLDGARAQAIPKRCATCPVCNREMVAKCGERIAWHWAHTKNTNCDPWWEPETEWHRMWKNYFPEEWQEVVQYDADTSEKHIAAVLTKNNMALEFQNSPMSPEELRSREEFYKRMIWIVNASKFRDSFTVLDKLPHPESAFANDLVFFPRKAKQQGRVFWRISENNLYDPENPKLVLIHSMSDIDEEIRKNYHGHHLYDWEQPRSVWFSARCPVFLDFGESDQLVLLSRYREEDPGAISCIRYISKAALVSKNGGIFKHTAGEI